MPPSYADDPRHQRLVAQRASLTATDREEATP